MRTGLTKQEKTTDIWFDEKDPLIHIRTHNTALKKRLLAYSRRYPAICQQTDADPETGCMEFDIEKGRFSFRLTAPYSEERREAARQYARENNAADRPAEKIDCPFSMPTGRKERPAMTKPREKTREEVTAEIEDGKKKIRQLENREKVLRQKLSQEERRTRSHRLIVRGAVFESIVPEAKTMTDEEAAAFLRLALTSEEARAYLKKRTEGGKSK